MAAKTRSSVPGRRTRFGVLKSPNFSFFSNSSSSSTHIPRSGVKKRRSAKENKTPKSGKRQKLKNATPPDLNSGNPISTSTPVSARTVEKGLSCPSKPLDLSSDETDNFSPEKLSPVKTCGDHFSSSFMYSQSLVNRTKRTYAGRHDKSRASSTFSYYQEVAESEPEETDEDDKEKEEQKHKKQEHKRPHTPPGFNEWASKMNSMLNEADSFELAVE